MKIGYAETLLAFAAVTTYHSLTWGLSIAALSLFIAFCRFAISFQEKREEKEKLQNATNVLNEQAEELGSALSKLFNNVTTDINQKNSNKKYH